MEKPITILLADDHDLVREGLKMAIRTRPGLAVMAEARDGDEALRKARQLRPDLVTMDIRMPGLNGIEACREIRATVPATRILMLTSISDEQAVMAAILAGAAGFVLKDASTETVLDAMETVGRGGSVLDPTAAQAVVEFIRSGQVVSPEQQLIGALSARERQVLDLVAEGLTNREIGERLFVSEKTVKHDVGRVLSHLGFARRAEAAAFVLRHPASD